MRTITKELGGVTQERPADAVEQSTSFGRVQSIRDTAAQFLGVPPHRVCDLLRNVWQTSKGQPPLTDAEMFMGMSMIARFGLDPIAREVYVTRTSKGLCTIIGLDGWIKVLNRVEGYDGFETELHHGPNGEIDWCETKIFSTKISRPTCYRAFASEYKKIAGFVAGQLPSHMLRIFSLRHAARLFTPIGGSVVTEEEARWMDAYNATPEDERTRKNTLKDKVQAAAKEFDPIPQPNGEHEKQTGAPDNLAGESEASSPETTAGATRAVAPAVSQRRDSVAGDTKLEREPGDDDEPEPSSPQARRLQTLAKCKSLKEIRHWWKSFEDESNAGMISQDEQIELVNAELALKAKIEGRLLP